MEAWHSYNAWQGKQMDPERGRSDREAWDAIVADLSADPTLAAADSALQPPPEPPRVPASDPMIDELLSDGHFEPPEPPPLPRPADLISRFAWAGAILGPTLILLSQLFGLPWILKAAGGAAALAGFATLVMKLPDRHRHVEDGTDGAVV